jgi:hypothetical protein
MAQSKNLRCLLVLAALALLENGAGPVESQAASSFAPGAVTISPTCVTPASIGDIFAVTYTAPTSRAVVGKVSVYVPAGWSPRQMSTPFGPGFVGAHLGSCGPPPGILCRGGSPLRLTIASGG